MVEDTVTVTGFRVALELHADATKPRTATTVMRRMARGSKFIKNLSGTAEISRDFKELEVVSRVGESGDHSGANTAITW